MTQSSERQRVLSMIEDGKLTVEEGMRLLAALQTAPGGEARPPARWLHLRITQVASGQVVANARLPLGAVALLQGVMGRFWPAAQALDLAGLVRSAGASDRGRLLDVVEDEVGQRVEIYIE